MKVKGLRRLKRKARVVPEEIKAAKNRQLNLNRNGKRGAGKRASVNKQELANRRLLAFEMRLSGKSYLEIGKELNISYVTVFKDVQQVLKGKQTDTESKAKQIRKIEVTRLDKLLQSVWEQATEGVPILNSKGKPVLDEKGNIFRVVDKKAIDRVLKIMERRAKLLGIDVPVKMQLGGMGEDEAPPIAVTADSEQRVMNLLQGLLKNKKGEIK